MISVSKLRLGTKTNGSVRTVCAKNLVIFVLYCTVQWLIVYLFAAGKQVMCSSHLSKCTSVVKYSWLWLSAGEVHHGICKLYLLIKGERTHQ